MSGTLAAGGGAAWPAPSCAGAHRSRAAAPPRRCPAPGRSTPRRNAPLVRRAASWPADRLALGAPVAGRVCVTAPGRNAAHCPGWPLQRQGHQRSFLTASQKRSLDPTLDPGASTSPAGLTARARPEARPEARAANLHRLPAAGSGSGRCGAGDSQLPVAGRECQCRPSQEQRCPPVCRPV